MDYDSCPHRSGYTVLSLLDRKKVYIFVGSEMASLYLNGSEARKWCVASGDDGPSFQL
jgi:hypothetical protein